MSLPNNTGDIKSKEENTYSIIIHRRQNITKNMSSLLNSMFFTAKNLRRDLIRSSTRVTNLIHVMEYDSIQTNGIGTKAITTRNEFDRREIRSNPSRKLAKKSENIISDIPYTEELKRRDELISQIECKFKDLTIANKEEINILEERVLNSERILRETQEDMRCVVEEKNKSLDILREQLEATKNLAKKADEKLKAKEFIVRSNQKKIRQAFDIIRHVKKYSNFAQNVGKQMEDILLLEGYKNESSQYSKLRKNKKGMNSAQSIKSLIIESAFLINAFKNMRSERETLRNDLEEKARVIREFQCTLETLRSKVGVIEEQAAMRIPMDPEQKPTVNIPNESTRKSHRHKASNHNYDAENITFPDHKIDNSVNSLKSISQRVNGFGKLRLNIRAADRLLSLTEAGESEKVPKLHEEIHSDPKPNARMFKLKDRIKCLEKKTADLDYERINTNSSFRSKRKTHKTFEHLEDVGATDCGGDKNRYRFIGLQSKRYRCRGEFSKYSLSASPKLHQDGSRRSESPRKVSRLGQSINTQSISKEY